MTSTADVDGRFAVPAREGETVLTVRNLTVRFRTRFGTTVTANRGVSYDLRRGETLALLGESGSGKSVSARAVMGLFGTDEHVELDADEIRLNDVDLLGLSERDWRSLRARRISMVSQDALASLNPVFPVGWQVAEVIRAHEKVTKKAAHRRVVELLGHVGIPSPARRSRDYPHEFSGGMRQRVMIAMAIALNPVVLIADEPTTALDVTIQREIMQLISRLKDEFGLAVLLITHDFGVVAEFAERVAVMYAGSMVEASLTKRVLTSPLHPYSEGLLKSVPGSAPSTRKLHVIPGRPPSLSDPLDGCPFAGRCNYRQPICDTERPELFEWAQDHMSACHFADAVGKVEGQPT